MSDTITRRSPPARASAVDVSHFVPVVQGLLRIGAGLLFMQHGVQKVFGALGGRQFDLLTQMGLVGVWEIVGGALVAVGLFTRPISASLVLLMASAYFVGHAGQGGFPIENGGELALLFGFVFLFLSVAGPGAWSLDGRLRRSS